ncbi:MAG TPA: alpha-1,2-fucosyltransferase [Flavipsychrobacter sp.]|nr:alpha-1,2-fucosyltransferase [Flavipsychrobacter sp.]
MVITSFTGGLGNQLFQYAFGKQLAAANKQRLYLEIESYKTDYLNRKFLLDRYSINAQFVSETVQKRILTKGTKVNSLLKRLDLIQTVEESGFIFQPQVATANKWINYYKGYWQSYKYFEEIRSLLLKEFSCKTEGLEKAKQEIFTGATTISIHIRRKDYLHDDRYGFVGESYYRDALQYLQQKDVQGSYLIFSDDIEWCKTFFSDLENVTYIGDRYGLEDYEELQLMANCDHHIIANSSFSWWGAWLGKNPHQIVVRPERPFREPSLLYEHHYPTHWIAVAN